MTGNRGRRRRRNNDPNRRESRRAVSWSTCASCGKQAYSSKKIAKAAARQLYPAGGMRVYACGSGNGSWHMTSQSTGKTTGIRSYLADNPPNPSSPPP